MQDREKPQSTPTDQPQQPQPPTPTLTTPSVSTPTPQVQPNLSPQQTQAQLCQKIKECRVLLTKNKKLQTKYIELFKQQKLLKKDWGVFTTIIKEILPNLEDKPVGRYDLEELKELWNTKEGNMIRKLEDLQDGMEKFKERVQREANQLAQEKIAKIMRQCKQKVDTVNKQLQSFKKNSKNLGDQLTDYDKKLEAKNDQVSKLTKQKLKLEHTINQMKVKSITDQLSNKGVEEEKINTERNQILSLRHQVSQLMHKRDQLRNELKSTKSANQKLKLLLQQKNKQLKKLSQQSHQPLPNPNPNPQPPLDKKTSISSISDDSNSPPHHHHNHNNNNSSQKQQQQQSPLSGDDEYIHRQYMKNVFIRYMRSWAKGDQSQAEILLNIILTMLKFDHKERMMVAERKKNWFGIY